MTESNSQQAMYEDTISTKGTYAADFFGFPVISSVIFGVSTPNPI